MIVKVGDLTGTKVIEVEVEADQSFAKIGNAAQAQFGYHGDFSVKLPSGEIPKRAQNLEDNEEFMGLTGDEVLEVVAVGTGG